MTWGHSGWHGKEERSTQLSKKEAELGMHMIGKHGIFGELCVRDQGRIDLLDLELQGDSARLWLFL